MWTWTARTDGKVTHVQLARTLPNQQGAYYHVADVPVGVTTYEEDILVKDMGELFQAGVGVPSQVWYAAAAWRERLWATDGKQIFPSEVLLFETFDIRNGLPVGPDDGGQVVGMAAADDRLYVINDNGVYYVTGDDPTMLLPHAWDCVWARAGRARPGPPVLPLDEAHLWPWDPGRIYVTGHSMGGAGAWHMIAHRPRFFAAAVPVCGHPLPATAATVKDVPIWNFHGDADEVEPVATSRVMIDAIRKAGGTPRHSEYAGVGHNVFMWAYTEPALVEWVFAQKR